MGNPGPGLLRDPDLCHLKFMKAYPSIEELREWFEYDPEKGVIYTKKRSLNGHHEAGHVVGTINSRGYYTVFFKGRLYLLHRLAYALYNGEHPLRNVDHINGITYDNRIQNLRLASQLENVRNSRKSHANTSGVKGVYWFKTRRKWVSRIEVLGKRHHLGYFDTIEEAAEVRRAAAEKYHGEFANHG